MNNLIQKGDCSITVLKIQQWLNQLLNPDQLILEDGLFEKETEEAIKVFQSQVGLNETGRIDTLTWDKLILKLKQQKIEEPTMKLPLIPLQYGAKGLDVFKIQEYLNLILPDFPLECTGYFDAKTQVNVIRFQNKMGLNPDGRVDLLTWNCFIDAL